MNYEFAFFLNALVFFCKHSCSGMPRRSGRQRVVWNYQSFASTGRGRHQSLDEMHRRQHSPSSEQIHQPVTPSLDTRVAQTPVTLSRRRRRSHVVNSNEDVQVEEGVLQCTSCKMQFKHPTASSDQHDRHHPSCPLFNRSLPLADADM